MGEAVNRWAIVREAVLGGGSEPKGGSGGQ